MNDFFNTWKMEPIELVYSGSPFNGSINYILNSYEDYEKNVSAKSSSRSSFSYCILNASRCKSSFYTDTDGPQWIQVGFKKSILYISSYSLMSSINPVNSSVHLKGWDFHASLDGHEWEIIDERRDNQDLNGNSCSKNFECKKGLYRYFRVVQAQKGFTNSYGFTVRQIELFGTLYPTRLVPKYLQCTRIQQRRTLDSYPFTLLIVLIS